jgi:hypothetical protein
MYYTRKFITYFIANLIVMYAAYSLAGNFVVFGRLEIGVMQAILTTTFGITLAAMFVDILLKDFGIQIQPDKYLTLELLVNMGTLYLLARTPLQNSVGVGITAFWVAIVIGFALSLAQYLVKTVTDMKK